MVTQTYITDGGHTIPIILTYDLHLDQATAAERLELGGFGTANFGVNTEARGCNYSFSRRKFKPRTVLYKYLDPNVAINPVQAAYLTLEIVVRTHALWLDLIANDENVVRCAGESGCPIRNSFA